MHFRSTSILLILSVVLSSGTNLIAKDSAGINLEEVTRLSVGGSELILNGSAVRKKAQHAIYVGGLYLKEQKTNFADIMKDPNPKRFLFYCSTSEISSSKLINAWEQGFSINYSDEEIKTLRPMITEFNKVWQSGLNVGDEVWVDYVPNKGTNISINGQLVSEIPGTEFYKAFLKTWLGPHPFNSRMKSALLGN